MSFNLEFWPYSVIGWTDVRGEWTGTGLAPAIAAVAFPSSSAPMQQGKEKALKPRGSEPAKFQAGPGWGYRAAV